MQSSDDSTTAAVQALTDGVRTDDRGETKPEEGAAVAAAEDLTTPCYLENTWNFYYDDGSSKPLSYEDFQNSLVSVGKFSTVQEFWHYWDGVPLDALPKYCNLRFFKDGIEPSWEHPQNCNGGKWGISHSPQNRAVIWREIVFALIGEQFIRSEDMCGIVLSVRTRGDSVHLWNGSPLTVEEVNAVSRQLRTILSLNDSFPVEYQRHFDSISLNEELSRRKKVNGHSPKSRRPPSSPHSPSSASSSEANSEPFSGRHRNGRQNRPQRNANSRQTSLDVDNNFGCMPAAVPHGSQPEQSSCSDMILTLPSAPLSGTPQQSTRPPAPSRQRRKQTKIQQLHQPASSSPSQQLLPSSLSEPQHDEPDQRGEPVQDVAPSSPDAPTSCSEDSSTRQLSSVPEALTSETTADDTPLGSSSCAQPQQTTTTCESAPPLLSCPLDNASLVESVAIFSATTGPATLIAVPTEALPLQLCQNHPPQPHQNTPPQTDEAKKKTQHGKRNKSAVARNGTSLSSKPADATSLSKNVQRRTSNDGLANIRLFHLVLALACVLMLYMIHRLGFLERYIH